MPKQNEKKKKRSFMEKVNPFDKESKARRARKKVVKSANKLAKAGKRVMADKKAKGTGVVSTKKSRAKAIGAKAGTMVRKGAIKKVSTKKGGDFVRYERNLKQLVVFVQLLLKTVKVKVLEQHLHGMVEVIVVEKLKLKNL